MLPLMPGHADMDARDCSCASNVAEDGCCSGLTWSFCAMRRKADLLTSARRLAPIFAGYTSFEPVEEPDEYAMAGCSDREGQCRVRIRGLRALTLVVRQGSLGARLLDLLVTVE
jgi:hypothetical protein